MNEKLLSLAWKAMKNSYSPYSGFKVGAAVFSESGHFYLGCNIENASYGATNCAERTAIFSAVAAGEKKLLSIAVVCSGNDFAYPCGICRQVISEFFPVDGKIILQNSSKDIKIFSVSELLPHSFKL